MALKHVALYTGLFGGALALGATKGYAVGQGLDTSLGMDMALVGAPLASGGLAAMLGPEKHDYGKVDCGGNIAGAVLVSGFLGGMQLLESGGHGVFGAAGAAVAEGVGIGAGYLAGKFL